MVAMIGDRNVLRMVKLPEPATLRNGQMAQEPKSQKRTVQKQKTAGLEDHAVRRMVNTQDS